LEAAVGLEGRPWPDGPPNYAKRVKRIYVPAEARTVIEQVTGAFAFDYETDRLKPDHPQSGIVCCSVSDGRHTISFPWIGEAVEAMGKLLRSDHPKIGANIKFEERWTRRVFGHGVRNWVWDTVQAAHVLDNRRGVSGLKFQSFVLLGQEPYDRSIESLLEAVGGNDKNQISKADWDDLLLYNGMDSLLTYEVAKKQRKEMRGWASKRI
jgi:hypothetical protein